MAWSDYHVDAKRFMAILDVELEDCGIVAVTFFNNENEDIGDFVSRVLDRRFSKACFYDLSPFNAGLMFEFS